jgi:putative pyruvate formate lyase activating enzyme
MSHLCRLCGFDCAVDRTQQLGRCGIDDGVYVSYAGLHFGEEPFLVGEGGSGTIFFLGCNLRCQFCQNYQISCWDISKPLTGTAKKITTLELVNMFFALEQKGAVNINFVSPTPYVNQIAEAITLARKKGFKLPFVYNTHGYDSQEVLTSLDGLIDIYLPDAKYAIAEVAEKYSKVKNYPEINKKAITRMFEQVGQLQVGENDLAKKGVAVRHLVLPNNLENSFKVLDFLAGFGKETVISLMAQYHPRTELLAEISPELRRPLQAEEYQQVQEYALGLGLENCLIQEMGSHDNYLPDFTKRQSF